jgi:hypothetical protein
MCQHPQMRRFCKLPLDKRAYIISSNESHPVLAEKFGVHPKTIARIKRESIEEEDVALFNERKILAAAKAREQARVERRNRELALRKKLRAEINQMRWVA